MSPEPRFLVVQGCPAPTLIAPYIYLVCKHAHINSIYRGSDAAAILHAHGHRSQAELYDGWAHRRPGFYPANRPGQSSHECRGDGHIYGLPVGAQLEDWQVGFDVNDSDVHAVIKRAEHYGWDVFQPYSSGSEFHHLNFRTRPQAVGKVREEIKHLRATLPRR